jgi:hypothetical protein
MLFGINSMNALPALLFSKIAVMTLIGFNARVVKEGMSKRGQSQRTNARPYVLMDPQTLAETICKDNRGGSNPSSPRALQFVCMFDSPPLHR